MKKQYTSKENNTTSTSKKKKNAGTKVVTIIGLFVITAVVCNFVSLGNKQATNKTKAETIEASEIRYKEISYKNIKNTHELWLVNAKHPLRIEISESSLVPAYKKIALSRSDIEMNAVALKNMEKMFTGAKKESITELVVTSGYRNRKRQSEIYEQAEDKSYVQKPGCSEHETGFAADIQLNAGNIDGLASTEQGRWLQENAWAYGFILRYPENKASITGISYEAWHFRYVGLPHSIFMKEKGLCFEEYIDYLKSNKQYAININNTKYQVYYTTEKNGKIKVPANLDYSISDDNCGGYIVSVILK